MDELLKAIESGDREAALTAFLGLAHDEQMNLLETLRTSTSEAVAAFLTAALEQVSGKDLQKAIKKLIFGLKTRGVRVEEPRTQGESVLKKVETTREEKAYLSNYDPDGTRVVLLAFEMRKKQYIFMHAISHFSKGLMELAAFPVSKEDLEKILKDYLWRTQRPMVLPSISPKYAYFLIDEAAAHSGKHIEDLKGLRPMTAGLKGNVQRPQDIYTLSATLGAPGGEATEPRNVTKGHGEILADGIFEPFLLTWDSLEADKKELAGTINPSIVLPPYVVEERRQLFLKGLLDKDTVTSQSRFMKRMLEDYAYLFHALGEVDMHRSIVAGLSGDGLVQAALLHFVRKSLEKKEADESGLLVNPYEQQPPPLRRK
jgi:hypothetical protein